MTKCKRCGERFNEWGEPLGEGDKNSGIHTCSPPKEWFETKEGKEELVKINHWNKEPKTLVTSLYKNIALLEAEIKFLKKIKQPIKTKIPFEWEKIYENLSIEHLSVGLVFRAKVFGGWILKEVEILTDDTNKQTITKTTKFIPDSNHEWEI